MKPKSWNILIFLIIAISAVAYLFIFSEGQIDPKLGSVPYVFWTGFLITVLVVFATFIGSKISPYEEPKKP